MNNEFRDEYDYENVQRKLMNSMKNEGYEDRAIEIAKAMLRENIDINIIIKCTGLTKKQIEEIKNE